jgi:coenzyme Q-binding protein COQ10
MGWLRTGGARLSVQKRRPGWQASAARPMPSFHESRTVPHAAGDMFELVADFERYPEFAPFCLAARIRKRSSEPSGVETLIADMEVGYGAIRARFATRDRLDREKGAISIVNISGPFKHFESSWTFRDLPTGGSRVVFSAQYQFSNPALEFLFSRVFDRVFSGLTRAFERRANQMANATPLDWKAPGPPDGP